MSIFKAYDIRGVYGQEITEDLACCIGYEYARMINADQLGICRDVRNSSPEVAEAVMDGVRRAGVDVLDAGVTTTPMSYYAIGSMDLDGGIMITASHNPPEYTGMKLSREQAIPVSGETGIQTLKKRVQNRNETLPDSTGTKGKLKSVNLIPKYRSYLREYLSGEPDRIPVVADGANGVVAAVFDDLVGDLNVQWTTLCMKPDGTFPNHPPNPLEEQNRRDIAAELADGNHHFGVAFDGDGDRAIFLGPDGSMISPEIITALISSWYLDRTKEPTIVYDLRSSRIVPETIRKKGGNPIRERVGHAFIKSTMREKDAVFGGELSGHYYFRNHYYADSALVALMHVLDLVAESGDTLAELVEPFQKYSQSGEINFEVNDKEGCIQYLAKQYEELAQDRLDGLTVESDDWWFNLRKSNTEPLLRLNLEATSGDLLHEKLSEVKEHIHSFEARDSK